MNQYLVDSPYTPFTIKNQFKAISNGKVYIGEVDKDPLNPSQQIQVYVVDESGSSVPVNQPIQLNAGGYLVYNGQVSKFVTLEPYSMVVLNSVGAEMWRVDDISKVDPDNITASNVRDTTNGGSVQDFIDSQAATIAEIATGKFTVGTRVRVPELSNSLWLIAFGGVIDGVTVRDAGSGKTAMLQYEAGMDIESFGMSEVATPAQNLAGLNAAINCETPFTSKQKTYVIGTGSIDSVVRFIDWKAAGTRIKLEDGAKVSALFVLDQGWSYKFHGMTWDGNRLNVTGNNAGFFVVTKCASFIAENTRFEDLRRYGYNLIGEPVFNSNVEIRNLVCDNVGVWGESDGGPVGYVSALGEAVKCEHVRNLTIEGFEVNNSSGTGDGQVQKSFYGVNIRISGIRINNVGPSHIYPAISNVRNRNLSYTNAEIIGASQVAIEDNANLSAIYDNISTFGRKAYIASSDGAEYSARHGQNIIIRNWDDTSTEATAFNMVAIQGLSLTGVATNQNINISRDDPSTDRRSRDICLNDVTCNNLSTLLTEGFLELNDCDIIGQWTNTHVGTALDNNSSIGAYSDAGQALTQLVRVTRTAEAIQIKASLNAGASATFKMPSSMSAVPFAGVVDAYNFFGPSVATQWSMLKWSFFDAGTPSVNKQVVFSGAVARSAVTLSVSAANKTLTLTNNEASDATTVSARVSLIDRNVYLG